jgi:hypothetical protein
LSLNKYSVNSQQLNALGNPVDPIQTADASAILTLTQETRRQEPSGPFLDIEQNTQQTELSGAFLTYENQTVKIGSGNVWQVWQTIELRSTVDTPEQIASFTQTTSRQEASGSLFFLSQRVRDLTLQQAQYKPFELDLVVGGLQIRDDELYGDLEITRAENDASILTFSILVPEGDVTEYVERQGQAVTLDYTDNATGKTSRMYTGKVNIPEIDFVEGIATYRCTDNRKEAINGLTDEKVSSFGYWSTDVFGEKSAEKFDEVEKRLETIPYSYDMNVFGNLPEFPTAWQPKAVADRVLTDSSVFRRSPSVEVLSRGRVVNQVNLEMKFQYQKLRYREQAYSFRGTGSSTCDYYVKGFPVPTQMIHEAIKATNWRYKNMRTDPNGVGCGSQQCGQLGGAWYNFSCLTSEGFYDQQFDDEGNPISAADGQNLNSFELTSTNLINKKYTNTAQWTSYLKFAQNVEETITLTVKAPQSITQYGLVERDQTMGVQIEYDTSSFEDQSVNFDLSNFSQSVNGDLVLDLDYILTSKIKGAQQWKDAYDCAYNRARTTILKSHRDNTISIEVPLIADLELSETMEISTVDWTACKGKVGAIRHTINMGDREAYTEVEIKLSRSIGSAPTETVPDYNAVRPQNRGDSTNPPSTILLSYKNYLDVGEPITDSMVGAIYKEGVYRTLAAFAVNTPPIEGQDGRENRELTASSTVEVPIPNDSLTIRHKR